MTTPEDLSNQLNACTFCGEDLAAFHELEEPERRNVQKAVVTIDASLMCPQCAAIRDWMSANEAELLKPTLREIRIRRGSLNVSVVMATANRLAEGEEDEF